MRTDHDNDRSSDFSAGFLFFCTGLEDEWRIYQDFMLEDNAKEYELVGEFSRFFVSASSVIS